MASKREALRDALPALGVAVPVTIVFVAVLGIVLTAAGPQGLGLTTAQTSTWIVAIYGLPAIPSVALAIRYRQPLLLTGNVFAVIFFGSLGTQFSFAELAGASLLAGAIVVLAAVLGLTRHLANWIPAPVVQGLIAGAVMPFVVSTFTGLSTVDTQASPWRRASRSWWEARSSLTWPVDDCWASASHRSCRLSSADWRWPH